MAAAPSFSSFPDLDLGGSGASETPNPDKDKKKSKRDKDRSRDDATRWHSKRKEKDDGDRHKRTRKKRDDDPQQPDYTHASTSKSAREDVFEPALRTADESQVWFIDRKGDEKNITYGGPHSYTVPRYKRAGYGRVLGLPNGVKLVKHGKGDVVVSSDRRLGTRYTSRRSLAVIQSSKPRLLRHQTEPANPMEELDQNESGFIPLLKPSRKEEKEKEKEDPSNTYRSIALPSDSEESDSGISNIQDTDSSDNDGTAPRDSYAQTSQALHRQLTQNPTSVPTWLGLISHSTSHSPTPLARSQVTLSIIERAFSSHFSNRGSPVLRSKYLRAGKDVWDKGRIKMEWDVALREVKGEKRGDVWIEWMGWVVGQEGVEALGKAVERILKESVSRGEDAEVLRLRVFRRACVLLREAGYIERAVATFQAQIELTFFTPSDLSTQPFQAQLSALEEWWDSEVPRIGEVDAKGWNGSVQSSVTSTTTSDSEASDRMAVDSANETDPYIRWSSAELLKSNTSILPFKSTEEDDDPYSTILFDDIKPFPFPPPPPHSKTRELLPYYFLTFLGLPIPGLSNDDDSLWSDLRLSDNPSLRAELFSFPNQQSQNDVPLSLTSLQLDPLIGKERSMREGWNGIKEWGFDLLRNPLDGWGVKGEGRIWESSKDLESVKDMGFMRRLFEQLDVVMDDKWRMYWIAFEAASGIKSAVKLSKTLLSNHRLSLPLWSTHAKLELIREKLGEARKIYLTCSSSIPSSGTSLSVDHIQLLHDWARLEWIDGKNQDAGKVLSRIVGMSDWDGGSGLGLLRVKKAFERLLQEYAGDIPSVLRIYEPHLVLSEAKSSHDIESLYLSSTLLVYYHTYTMSHPSPPALLREHVEQAIRLFPSNTLLLGVWLQCERGQAVWGRVRRTVGDVILGGKDKRGVGLMRWVWAIWVEKWERGSWEVERVRGMLGTAVEDETARSSSTLWRLYIELEIGMRDLKKARSLLYRAVAECPLAKDLYLLAFGPLRSIFAPSELNEWVNTMAERGIRVRLNIEDYLEGWKEDASDASSSEDEGVGEEEIETIARERKRLMPY